MGCETSFIRTNHIVARIMAKPRYSHEHSDKSYVLSHRIHKRTYKRLRRLSSGMLRRVVWLYADVSVVLTACVIREMKQQHRLHTRVSFSGLNVRLEIKYIKSWVFFSTAICELSLNEFFCSNESEIF